jgi:hypothetical protein
MNFNPLPERHRKVIGMALIVGIVGVVLLALALFALDSIRPDESTATPWRVAIPALIKDTQPTQTAVPTQPPATALPTPIPSPSPTTTPPPSPLAWPTGYRSKLGVHGIWPNRILEFTQAVAEAGAPFTVVKAVDDLGWLTEVKRVSPGTITVGRLTHAHEGASLVNDPGVDLDGYAGVLMEPILTKLQNDPALGPAVDYWEPINEPLGGGAPPEAYGRLAQAMIRCMEIAEANGLRLALFGFSAGTPEWADLVAIVDTGVFARAQAGGHILTLHEGVFGDDPIDMWWNAHFVDAEGSPTREDTGMTAPGGWLPGGPVLEGAGALSLRYRFLYHLLQERDQVVPLFVSEFYAGGGHDPADKADVVARMLWYDAQVAADAYVLGFAPFTLGPTAQWTDEDYEPFYVGPDGLAAYVIALGGGSSSSLAPAP